MGTGDGYLPDQLCGFRVAVAAGGGEDVGGPAQDALVGGGRYDGLLEQLGGRVTPACGFAIGLERVAHLVPDLVHALVEIPLNDRTDDTRRATSILGRHGLRCPRFDEYAPNIVRFFAEHEDDPRLKPNQA